MASEVALPPLAFIFNLNPSQWMRRSFLCSKGDAVWMNQNHPSPAKKKRQKNKGTSLVVSPRHVPLQNICSCTPSCRSPALLPALSPDPNISAHPATTYAKAFGSFSSAIAPLFRSYCTKGNSSARESAGLRGPCCVPKGMDLISPPKKANSHQHYSNQSSGNLSPLSPL